MHAVLFTDGGARGNPGPAGIGVVLMDTSGEVLGEIADPIGTATNNVAEYKALIAGLELALDRGVTDLEVRADSELVVQQVQGNWKIKNEALRGLAARAQGLSSKFERFTIRHVRRADNARADELANVAMDSVSSESDSFEQGTFDP
ncbi:MAG: ribonuclease HI family protein [Actinomycetota bacterium]|nr:ribonuclease HI family protein [Actinomycetota bacterium]